MHKHAKLKAGIGLVLAVVLLLFGLAGLILNNHHTQALMINHAQTNILKRTTAKSIQNHQSQPANFNANQTKDATTNTVIYNQLHQKYANAIGIMSIPQINMQNPIFNGYGNNGAFLALGACTMKPNQVMGQGNYALAGHYMAGDTVFHELSHADVGMKVYITNLKHIYVYTINHKSIINHYDVGVINDVPQQKMITLITCIQLNATPYRTLVQGQLTQVLPASSQNLKQYQL